MLEGPRENSTLKVIKYHAPKARVKDQVFFDSNSRLFARKFLTFGYLKSIFRAIFCLEFSERRGHTPSGPPPSYATEK